MNNVSQKQEKIYFGLDISQKTIEIFALKGEKGVPFGKILNNQKSLNDFFDKVPFPSKTITVALETGTQKFPTHQNSSPGVLKPQSLLTAKKKPLPLKIT